MAGFRPHEPPLEVLPLGVARRLRDVGVCVDVDDRLDSPRLGRHVPRRPVKRPAGVEADITEREGLFRVGKLVLTKSLGDRTLRFLADRKIASDLE